MMRALLPLTAAFLLSPLVTAGCGGDNTTSTTQNQTGGSAGMGGSGGAGGAAGMGGAAGAGGAGAGSPGATCADLAEASCYLYSLCGPYYLPFQLQYGGDVEHCEERVTLSCEAYADPKVPVNDACVKALSGTSCDSLIKNGYPVECLGSKGPTPDGGACGASGECQSGYCNAKGGGCGTCEPTKAEGQACSGGECAPGLSCLPVMGKKQCVRLPGSGEPCLSNVCAAGLRCAVGVCALPTQKVGDVCNSSLFCDYTLQCDSGGKCAPYVFHKVGETCGFDPGTGESSLCLGSRCVTQMGMGMGTCTAFVEDGGACDTVVDCMPNAVCQAGVCSFYSPPVCN